MFQRLRTLNQTTALAAAISLMSIAPVRAQETVTPEDPSGDAGTFAQSGGTVKRKLARTRTTSTSVPETAGWYRIPYATLAYTVPAGTTDLFNVSFTAECRLFNSSQNDYVRIRVVDLNTGIPLEPYDGAQAFFSDNNYATHTGMWSKRLGPGVHTLQVEVWIYDAPLNGALSAWIDDWTFEVIIYD